MIILFISFDFLFPIPSICSNSSNDELKILSTDFNLLNNNFEVFGPIPGRDSIINSCCSFVLVGFFSNLTPNSLELGFCSLNEITFNKIRPNF